MTLLRPATNEMAFGKLGILGFAGSGKTYTASLIAIGLHAHVGSKKPIAFLDTETGSDFVLPLFRKAGVELLVAKSKTFVDLMAFIGEARQAADIAIIDSVTHVWNELQQGFLDKINAARAERRLSKISKLEFQHWGPIKGQWRLFTDAFLSVPMHVIICGRAGYEYSYEQEEEGAKKELIKVGTKMKAEGEFAYEPSLLIEMEKVQTGTLATSPRKQGTRSVVNRAFVIKDRADILDGAVIETPGFADFLPHFQALNIGGTHRASDAGAPSTALFDGEGRGDWDREKVARQKWVEEIEGLFTSRFPGQSAIEKKAKADALQEVFGTRSWTEIAERKSADIKAGFGRLCEMFKDPAATGAASPVVAPVESAAAGDTKTKPAQAPGMATVSKTPAQEAAPAVDNAAVPACAATAPAAMASLVDYKMPFGTVKGKALRDIDLATLVGIAEYYQGTTAKKRPQEIEASENVLAYLRTFRGRGVDDLVSGLDALSRTKALAAAYPDIKVCWDAMLAAKEAKDPPFQGGLGG